jgi:hypothetical protein
MRFAGLKGLVMTAGTLEAVAAALFDVGGVGA